MEIKNSFLKNKANKSTLFLLINKTGTIIFLSALSKQTRHITTAKLTFFQNSSNLASLDYRIQVPTIVNHCRNYISFGTDDPQLCFHYTITDNEGKLEPVSMYQKFVFHLSWAPEEFQDEPVDDLVTNGELEFF